MRVWAVAFLLCGLGLAAWLIASVGLPAIASALEAIGLTGLLAVIGVHLIASVVMAAAWWTLRRSTRFGVFVWGRLVRDGGSEVLPLSQVGGFMLAVRVLVAHGVAGAAATATTMVDAILEFLAEIGYLAIGLALVVHLLPRGRVVSWSVGVPVAVAAATIVGLILMRRTPSDGLRALAARLVRRGLGPLLQGIAAVRTEMVEIAGRKRILAISFLLHLAAWIVSGVEAWMALRFMGVRLGLDTVLAIESLVYATRSLGFVVPNAIGIQEGAYVVVGASLGLAPEFALGLSLLKRGRDLALGIPALASWHLFEARRAAEARAPAA